MSEPPSGIVQSLKAIEDESVDAALADALPTADDDAAVQFTELLLERNRLEGLRGLIEHFSRLPQPARQAVLAQSQQMNRPLRLAAMEPAGRAPFEAATIIEQSMHCGLAYLLAEQLRRGGNELREHVAGCLHRMAQQAATPVQAEDSAAPLDAERVAWLCQAIEEAIHLYEAHHQTAALVALLWMLPRPLPAQAESAITDPHRGACTAIRRLLVKAEHPAVRRAMPSMLPLPSLADAAIEGMRQAAGRGELGACVQRWHLLMLPEARQTLARLRSGEALRPSEDSLEHAPPSQQLGLLMLAMALPSPRARREATLEPFLQSTDTAVRLAAVRQLLTLARDAGAEDPILDRLARCCEDREPAIARLALWRLLDCGYKHLARTLAAVINGPHKDLQRIAGRQLAGLGFARLWSHWPQMEPERRLAAGRALIKIDPDFHRQLADRLAHGNRKEQLRALSIIQTLGQSSFFEPALVRLTQSDDERLASAAVTALGQATGGEAVHCLENALDHSNSRVRANAIEAMMQLRVGEHLQRLRQIAQDDENRPRANAIAALMDLSAADALAALNRMLEDPRPEHRTSALWVVESLGLVQAARAVAELSISDPNPDVKKRADRVVRHLIELLSDTADALGMPGQDESAEQAARGAT